MGSVLHTKSEESVIIKDPNNSDYYLLWPMSYALEPDPYGFNNGDSVSLNMSIDGTKKSRSILLRYIYKRWSEKYSTIIYNQTYNTPESNKSGPIEEVNWDMLFIVGSVNNSCTPGQINVNSSDISIEATYQNYEDSDYTYKIKAHNIGQSELKDVKIYVRSPEGMNYIPNSGYVSDVSEVPVPTMHGDKTDLQWSPIDSTLAANGDCVLSLDAGGVNPNNLSVYAMYTKDGQLYSTPHVNASISDAQGPVVNSPLVQVNATYLNKTSKTSKCSYTICVQNIGQLELESVQLVVVLPEDLKYIKATVDNKGMDPILVNDQSKMYAPQHYTLLSWPLDKLEPDPAAITQGSGMGESKKVVIDVRLAKDKSIKDFGNVKAYAVYKFWQTTNDLTTPLTTVPVIAENSD